MKIKTKVHFHNRFEIEVRDGQTGALKEKGQAENIVLNSIYTRLCNTTTYFSTIHFGRGAGTPTPDRNSLFDRIGSKSAETEETIRAFPTSSWTRQIRLMPEEFVGETLTEVGIGFGSGATEVVTHAMIKDAEGNPLSLTKTSIDVVTIYATVFVTFMSGSSEIDFYTDTDNKLMMYLTGTSFSNPELFLGDFGGSTMYNGIGYYKGTFVLNRINDVANRKITFSNRIGIDNHNFDIRELFLLNILRVNLQESSIWNGQVISENIGVGDGVTTTFELPWYDLENLELSLDGQVTSNYTTANLGWENKELHPFAMLADAGVIVTGAPPMYKGMFTGIVEEWPFEDFEIEVNPTTIIGTAFRMSVRGGYYLGDVIQYVHIAGSYDGVTYVDEATYTARGSTVRIFEHVVDQPYTHLRIRFSGGRSAQSRVNYFMVLNQNPQPPVVTFNTPPQAGQTIQATGKVPYIPKTTNYVLDVSFTLQYGEGV